jgi:uncharacterized protein with HEPN domain
VARRAGTTQSVISAYESGDRQPALSTLAALVAATGPELLVAIDTIRSHVARGTLDDGLVIDAVRIRLLEVGEAVKALPEDLVRSEPSIPWRQIAGMRDPLAHRYFDTNHAIVAATVQHDLSEFVRRRSAHPRGDGGRRLSPSSTSPDPSPVEAR